MDNARLLTYGEKAVGLTFNPSNDPMVQKVKELYAQIIDLCDQERIKATNLGNGGEKVRLFSIAITEAQGAQMWAVKGITMIITDGVPMGATTSDNKAA